MKKNDASKVALLEQLRKTPILQIACEKVGISRVTLYRWRAADAEFAKAIDEAMLEGRLMVNDLAESQLISAVKDRNITAILAWLKHNHPNYRTRVEIEGSLRVIEELSPEQAEQVKKALALANVTLHNHE
jgi:ACT domain-containing protein